MNATTENDRGRAAAESVVWDRGIVRRDRARLTGRVEVDLAVIGAGLTGLSIAYHALRADPGRAVMILEAERVGSGASGRSTGIVGPGVGGTISYLARKHGAEQARKAFEHSRDAVDTAVKLVRTENIDCDLAESAHLLCAGTKPQMNRHRRDIATFEKLGVPTRLLDRAELAERLGHHRYLGALEYRPVVVVNPLKLTLGLADAAERLGARIVEHSPVTELAPAVGGVRLWTRDGGEVLARTAVVATDGHTPAGLPHGDRVVSVRTHVLATRPLTEAELAATGWSGREAVIDQRTFFAYYRLDAERRLLFGGGPVLRPGAGVGSSEKVWQRLERELAEVFPTLRDVPIEHRWSGLTGSTIDRMPVVGEVPGLPGVVFAGAWCGHGLSLSIAEGAWLGPMLTGPAPELGSQPWRRTRTGTPRLGPFRSPFVAAYVAALDGLDRGGAAVQRLRSPRTP